MFLKIEEFELELKEPVKAYKRSIKSKYGYVVSLEYNGQIQKAEASTWDITKHSKIKKELLNEKHKQKLLESIQNKLSIWQFKVDSDEESVRFAYSSLYLQICSPEIKECRINGLLDADDPHVIKKATAMTHYPVTKLKVLPKTEHKLSLLELLRKTQLKFRLDGNRNFSLEEALQFCTDLPSDRIDYFEDPLQTPVLLEEFYKKSQIRYSLDESKDLLSQHHSGIHSFILKPMLLGDFTDIKKYMGSIPVVISSTYESEIGLKNLIQWAHHLNPSGIHGLGTHDVFKKPLNLFVKDGVLSYEE